MYASRRQSEILKTVQNKGSCTIGELAISLGVSDETIRRNLKPLSDQGLVRRVHGGVTLLDSMHEAPFQKRIQENAAAKERIAEAVSREIQDGDTMILDCGSTTTFVARRPSPEKEPACRHQFRRDRPHAGHQRLQPCFHGRWRIAPR